ncbi:MAG: tetratricopeptide repeat protein [Acidobacteria bacterium]|nr:tetratricopeptide repeat protein [Acidobacteriota bacterium]
MKNWIKLMINRTGIISWGLIFILFMVLCCFSGRIIAQSSQTVNPAKSVSNPAAVKNNNSLTPDNKPKDKEASEINTDLLNKANELFKAGNYEEALKAYSEAAGGNPDNPVINYNIGNVLYKTGKMEPAIQKYKSADSINKSLYNTGNSLYRMQKLQEALAAYRQALIKNPNDPDAKFNYEFVKKKLEEQQKQQQGQDNKNQDQQNKDQNKDQENKDQNKDQQEKDKKENKGSQDQQNSKQDQKQDKKQDKKEQQQEKKRIDPKQAQSMLQELQEKEKELMKKMIEAQKVKASKTKKDW